MPTIDVLKIVLSSKRGGKKKKEKKRKMFLTLVHITTRALRSTASVKLTISLRLLAKYV